MANKYKKLLCMGLVMVLLSAVAAGCGEKQPPEQTQPPNETQGSIQTPVVTQPTTPEEPATEPPVRVVMPEYELSYSGPLANLISWQEQPESGGLQFSVKLSTGDGVLFTLLLNQAEGEIVIMKENTAGQKVPISFRMAETPENLNAEDRQLFLMAQDTVNEIIASLTLK